MPDFSPAQLWRLLHPPAQFATDSRPGTRLIPNKGEASEEGGAYAQVR